MSMMSALMALPSVPGITVLVSGAIEVSVSTRGTSVGLATAEPLAAGLAEAPAAADADADAAGLADAAADATALAAGAAPAGLEAAGAATLAGGALGGAAAPPQAARTSPMAAVSEVSERG